MFELFHGVAPFRGHSMDMVMNNIKRGNVSFKKSLDPIIKDLIIKILVINPMKRPSIQEILNHPLY